MGRNGCRWMSARVVTLHLACVIAAACQATPPSPDVSRDAPSLRIVATDEGHESPDTVSSGLRHVRFENHGTQIHEAMFVRLPDGMSAADYAAAVAGGEPFPKGAIDCSGPGLTSPGETLDLWVELEPGRHVLICWFSHPTPDGSFRQHVVMESPRELIVREMLENDPAPVEDAVIRLVDYRFELRSPIKPGVRTVRVEMAGPSMHEMDIYRLGEGQDLAALKAWFAAKRRTPLPGIVIGGVLDSHAPGRRVWIRRTFVPGRYVAWCGMDAPSAPGVQNTTHADIGMVLEFTVAD